MAAATNGTGNLLDVTDASIEENFSRDGFVCLSNVVSKEFSDIWLAWSAQHVEHLTKTLYENGYIATTNLERHGGECALGQGVKHGFREIVMRSPGRYELSLLECQDDRPPLDELQAQLELVVPKLLGEESLENLKLCHVSLVIALSGAADQGWHADGGHVNVQKHVQCHVLNVFIPLVDISQTNGPTELRPGSHYLTRNLAPLMLAAKARKTLRAPVLPILKRTDALVFDYRTLHRGRANSCSQDSRPILVLTYAKKWYKDICNFPKNSMYERRQKETTTP